MTRPIDLVLACLPGAKKKGMGWTAHCPAHEDKSPSLSIGTGDDDRVLLRCFAGCEIEAIIEALGLTMTDLFPPNNHKGTARRIIATYDYCGEDGNLLYQVVRFHPKDFRQRRPDGNGGWIHDTKGVQRVLYHLPQLLAVDPADLVLIVEGEKDVEALEHAGFIATTNIGGAGKWRPEYSEVLRDRHVVILPDNDDPGHKHAQAVAKSLHGIAASVKVIHLRGLPDKGDVSDLLNSGGTADSLRKLFDNASEWTLSAEPAKATTSRKESRHTNNKANALVPIPAFSPFPISAMPHPVKSFVTSVAVATGTDPAYAGLAALAMLAGSIGNRVAALVKRGWSEPAVLWVLLVGRSGTTKSSVFKLVTQPLVKMYKQQRAAFVAAITTYETAKARYDVERSAWRQSQKSGPPTDPPLEPDPPIQTRVMVSDITVEKLGSLLQQNPLGLLLVRDEAAAWVGAFDRYSGGKGSDQPAWLSFADASPLVIDRKSGPSLFVERGAVSVLGGIQPRTLTRVFGESERESGLLARCLLTWPPEQPAIWNEGELPDDVADEWHELLNRIQSMPTATDEHGNVKPVFLPLADDAKALFIPWQDNHVCELDGLDDDLRSHFSKLKGIGIRIALIFTVADLAAGDGVARCITADAMQRAIEITDWLKHEAARVYALLHESPEHREQRELCDWIAKTIERQGKPITARDLTRGPRRFRGQHLLAEAALSKLVDAGLGEWIEPKGNPQGGRPARSFQLTAERSGDGDETPSEKLTGDETTSGDSDNGGFVTVASVAIGEVAHGPEVSSPSPDEWGEV